MSRGDNAFSIIGTVQEYIQKMISVAGMKALLLDEETVRRDTETLAPELRPSPTTHPLTTALCPAVRLPLSSLVQTLITGLVLGQSEIISKEVFLVERLDKRGDTGENYQHLKALVFCRPSQDNLRHIRDQLHTSKYKEYHFFFSNVTGDDFLRQLAEADEKESIRTVSEYYADYYALTDNLFTLHIPLSRSLARPQHLWLEPERTRFVRTVSGLSAFFASLKRKPEIRYAGASELCKGVGLELSKMMRENNDLFNYPQADAPLLLLCDRRDDPVTPLLTQWTYQAMVHEVLGIRNNTVDLRKIQPPVDKSTAEVVLSVKDDKFYKDSMFLNFGELGSSIKSLVVDYQRKTKTNQKLDTIEDMQRFVDQFPEFKSLAGNVSKHVTLMHVLSDSVKRRQLLRLSELEQDLACSQDHGKAIREIFPILEDLNIAFEDKVRVVALYGLRYERENNQLGQLKGVLRGKAQSEEDIHRSQVVDEMLKYAGAGVRGGDLFGNKNILSKMITSAKSTVKGVDNIYTQHKPALSDTLLQLSQGKLTGKTYPYLDAAGSKQGGRYRLVVAYFLGGATYEEVMAVHEFNATNQVGMKVVVGGSTVLNSREFIDDVLQGADNTQAHSNSNGSDFS